VQARAEELADHEEQLEAWKQKFKAEALRQISEREKALSDWQAKLDRKKTDLEELQRSVEVKHPCQ
jgi:DNA-binding protein H-NS